MKRSIITFFRTAKNNPKLFLINLLGFSIGITAVLFIYLYAFKELSTDRFHKNNEDLYRVLSISSSYDMMSSSTILPLGDLLQKHFPEIENYARVSEPGQINVSTTSGEFTNQDIIFVDGSFFELFDFRLRAGDYNQLFDTPGGVVISKKLANLAFEGQNPVGEQFEFTMPGDAESKRYTITGVLEDFPEESSFSPQVIGNISYFEERFAAHSWSIMIAQTFLYMPHATNPEKIASQIAQIIADGRNEATGNYYEPGNTKYSLQPFNKMYMHSMSVRDEMPKGDVQLVRIMLIIGVSILILIWLNYIILNMGILSKNKSFGQLHFILGGNRGGILKKYLQHALLFALLSFLVVLFIYPLAYKIISSFSGYHYSLFEKSDLYMFSFFILALLLFGLLSGTFQYVFSERLSGGNLSENRGYKRKRFFNALIQFQLVVFIVLVASMFFVNRQIKLIRQSDLGFDTENTFSLSMPSDQDFELFKQEFSQFAFVKSITHGEQLFSPEYRHEQVGIDGTDQMIETQVIQGDDQYIEAYGIELVMGRNLDDAKIPNLDAFFDFERKRNTQLEVLVNEEFVRKAGLENPVGKMLTGIGLTNAQIVGVIADVRNLPVYYGLKPMVIAYDLGGYSMTLSVAVMNGYEDQFLAEAMEFYKERDMQAYFDQMVFSYDYEQIYQSENALSKLIQIFSSIVLVIMVLGMVGLSLYLSQSKTKEIGIRKVNGAKVSEILTLLNKDFVKWVVIAFVIATPVAWYTMNKWLENFAYKTNLSWWVFALAGLLALGIALVTVSWQSWRAANRNPVEALRYE